MKNSLKKFICENLKLYYLFKKIQEVCFKILLNSDKAKEKYIQKKFKERVGCEIDFNKEPKTFNEKIQFRKLYDKNPLYSICADKYRVREYIKNKIGEEYLIPLLLVTDKLKEEQWDKLPNQFVAKANHNSGPVQIVKDKLKANKKEIIKELNNQLRLDYGILSLENSYSNISRKIVVEEFLEDNIKDYKIFCFNGKAKIMFVALDRSTNTKFDFYDMDFKKIDLKQHYSNSNIILEKPSSFEKMKQLAEKLSEDFSHVRVDFYDIKGKVYFGELTFCHFSGLEKFEPHKYDELLGSWFELDKKIINKRK
ncbi:ATP-grasp fold amidoligase family protein [Fusobacterium sp. IOR10]|uniref:ATP-grasp fold amidoligase family protein n=1 Tax=Fusobacterium sp. IOR10 TaxID=2665157 RepID=UPI0013D11068|nr:ATP-grasp fold amidoligase family protein [Fusobacterium sp. IOR10]